VLSRRKEADKIKTEAGNDDQGGIFPDQDEESPLGMKDMVSQTQPCN
jgi:hypothetical protein